MLGWIYNNNNIASKTQTVGLLHSEAGGWSNETTYIVSGGRFDSAENQVLESCSVVKKSVFLSLQGLFTLQKNL